MGNQGEEQERSVRVIDPVVAGQDTRRDGRCSNRNKHREDDRETTRYD